MFIPRRNNHSIFPHSSHSIKLQVCFQLYTYMFLFLFFFFLKLYSLFPSLFDLLPGPHQKIFENLRQFHNFIKVTFTEQKKNLDVNDQRNLIDAFLVKQQEVRITFY